MAEGFVVGIRHIFFIHASADERLDCILVLATVSNAAVNSRERVRELKLGQVARESMAPEGGGGKCSLSSTFLCLGHIGHVSLGSVLISNNLFHLKTGLSLSTIYLTHGKRFS